MKTIRVNFERKQAEGLLNLLTSLIEDWPYELNLMGRIWQSLLIEVREALNVRLADGYKKQFVMTWRAPHALALQGFFEDILDDKFIQTHTGIKILQISNEINQQYL